MPIKRDPRIIPLSKAHHFCLLFCWKVSVGLEKNIYLDRIRNYMIYFWKCALSVHFEQEEKLLFKLIEHPLCEKARLQYQEIRHELTEIFSGRKHSANDYASIVQKIQKHIRFEERELFPYLEKNASKAVLDHAGEALKDTVNTADDYPDEFWK